VYVLCRVHDPVRCHRHSTGARSAEGLQLSAKWWRVDLPHAREVSTVDQQTAWLVSLYYDAVRSHDAGAVPVTLTHSILLCCPGALHCSSLFRPDTDSHGVSGDGTSWWEDSVKKTPSEYPRGERHFHDSVTVLPVLPCMFNNGNGVCCLFWSTIFSVDRNYSLRLELTGTLLNWTIMIAHASSVTITNERKAIIDRCIFAQLGSDRRHTPHRSIYVCANQDMHLVTKHHDLTRLAS
jgi:hypothetical protein